MNFIAELATTNMRIAAGVLMAVAFVAFIMAGILLGKITDANTNTILALGSFILLQEGIDVTQFAIKRYTYAPEAHDTPPREDVQPPKPPAAMPAAVQEAP